MKKLLLFSLLSLALSCGYDETYTGLGDGALPGDPLYHEAEADTLGGLDIPEGPLLITEEELLGRVFRMESLVLDSPLTGTLGDGINNYFAKGFGDGSLNIVLKVESLDEGIMELRIAPAKGEDLVIQGEGGLLACSLEGAGFTTHIPSSLDFPNEMLTPPAIPLQALSLSGFFDPQAEEIAGGILEGALSYEAAEQVKLMGVKLSMLLTSLKAPMTLDLSKDGEPDAWLFHGVFAATMVEP